MEASQLFRSLNILNILKRNWPEDAASIKLELPILLPVWKGLPSHLNIPQRVKSRCIGFFPWGEGIPSLDCKYTDMTASEICHCPLIHDRMCFALMHIACRLMCHDEHEMVDSLGTSAGALTGSTNRTQLPIGRSVLWCHHVPWKQIATYCNPSKPSHQDFSASA